ncbi:MAG: CBS domain-containing protein [Gammaproteobacteria bacterium]|jgi:predicted transcriptional regulator
MEKKLIRVKDIMRTQFETVERNETVRNALSKMKNSNTRALIVNKRNENDEYGIVVLADIAKKVLANDRSPDRINVYEIMTKPVVQVSPDMDIRYCARLFYQFGLERAPVVENGEIVGMVSYHVLVLRGLVQLV